MSEGHAKPARDQFDSIELTQSQSSLSIWRVIGSVLASFFGVQSSANRTRDFQSGKARQFVVVGLIMTAACCLTLYLIVLMVIWLAR